MPTPQTVDQYETLSDNFEVKLNRFLINYGYKERDSVQVRLENDGRVYLCRHTEGTYPKNTVSAKVPFDLFTEELPRFIQFLEAKAAKEENASDT